MNGKQAKRLRRKAEHLTVGKDIKVTRKVYKELKKNFKEKWRKYYIELR